MEPLQSTGMPGRAVRAVRRWRQRCGLPPAAWRVFGPFRLGNGCSRAPRPRSTGTKLAGIAAVGRRHTRPRPHKVWWPSEWASSLVSRQHPAGSSHFLAWLCSRGPNCICSGQLVSCPLARHRFLPTQEVCANSWDKAKSKGELGEAMVAAMLGLRHHQTTRRLARRTLKR